MNKLFKISLYLSIFSISSCSSSVYSVNNKSYHENDNVFVVSFEYGNGESSSYLNVKKDKTISEPKTPEREGYNFLGWYNGTTKWNFESNTISSNLTLVANWIDNSSNVEDYIYLNTDDSKIQIEIDDNSISKSIKENIDEETEIEDISYSSYSKEFKLPFNLTFSTKKQKVLPLDVILSNSNTLEISLGESEKDAYKIGNIVKTSLIDLKTIFASTKETIKYILSTK